MNINIFLIIAGLLACIGLTVFAYKCIRERYTLLRYVGKLPPVFPKKDKDKKKSTIDKPLYKKFLRHKYSKGSSYDRAKLRYNRFQKNYV